MFEWGHEGTPASIVAWMARMLVCSESSLAAKQIAENARPKRKGEPEVSFSGLPRE